MAQFTPNRKKWQEIQKLQKKHWAAVDIVIKTTLLLSS
jgi:hypothetical protein